MEPPTSGSPVVAPAAFTVALPQRMKRIQCGRYERAGGPEVDALMEASAALGYLLLPWGGRNGCDHRNRQARLLHSAWWNYCERRGLPFLVVEVKPDGRALAHYDLLHAYPLECGYIDLADDLDEFFDACPKDKERALRIAMTPMGGKRTFYAGRQIGWVAFYVDDPRPLEITLTALRTLITQEASERRQEAERQQRQEQGERRRKAAGDLCRSGVAITGAACKRLLQEWKQQPYQAEVAARKGRQQQRRAVAEIAG